MQSNLSKSLEKIIVQFEKVNSFAKAIIKYGVQATLALLALGTFLIIYNRLYLGFDLYLQLIATTLVKNSFIILAEVIIGGLLIDFIFKKS